jgi:hypothetical protein
MLLAAAVTVAAAREHESLDQLKMRVDRANPKDRVGLALQVAERQVGVADTLYSSGKADEARAAVQDAVTYTEKAKDAATQSGKKLKEAEITVRKLAHKLADIKRSVNFEDQSSLQEAIDHLEHIRTQLLNKMFDLEKSAK